MSKAVALNAVLAGAVAQCIAIPFFGHCATSSAAAR